MLESTSNGECCTIHCCTIHCCVAAIDTIAHCVTLCCLSLIVSHSVVSHSAVSQLLDHASFRTHNHTLAYPLSLVLEVMMSSKELKTSRSILMPILRFSLCPLGSGVLTTLRGMCVTTRRHSSCWSRFKKGSRMYG